MATITEFTGSLRTIDGVADYVLLRLDGRLLDSSSGAEEALLSMLTFVGRSAAAIGVKAGLSRLDYLELGRKGGQNLLVFPFHGYLLGITRKPEMPSKTVAAEIDLLLQSLSRN